MSAPEEPMGNEKHDTQRGENTYNYEGEGPKIVHAVVHTIAAADIGAGTVSGAAVARCFLWREYVSG